MNTCSKHFEEISIFVLCSVLSAHLGAAQFIDVTAEVEIYSWSSTRTDRPWMIHCVVGTNAWRMDGDFCSNCKMTFWFTGREIIEHNVVDRALSPLVLREPEIEGPPVGTESTHVYDCLDGNPCLHWRAREPDRLDLLGNIGWLAFCSGPFLRRDQRELFPPSSFWKEMVSGDHFADRTTVFQDQLGLPKSLELYATNSQPLVQYQVTASTNVLGWEFPTEFYLAQYRPAHVPGHRSLFYGTNGWELEFTARGRVTGIGAGTRPEIPPEILKAAGK